MKQIILILLLILTIGCKERDTIEVSKDGKQLELPKYQIGELVFLSDHSVIVVNYSWEEHYYMVKLIDCKVETECFYVVEEDAITKEPKY